MFIRGYRIELSEPYASVSFRRFESAARGDNGPDWRIICIFKGRTIKEVSSTSRFDLISLCCFSSCIARPRSLCFSRFLFERNKAPPGDFPSIKVVPRFNPLKQREGSDCRDLAVEGSRAFRVITPGTTASCRKNISIAVECVFQ